MFGHIYPKENTVPTKRQSAVIMEVITKLIQEGRSLWNVAKIGISCVEILASL